MTEPKDDEILEAVKHLGAAMLSPVEVARAVLAKWGTPPGWLPFPLHLQNPDGRTLRTSAYLLERHGYKECSVSLRNMADVLLATTPQPTRAQAGAAPLTDEQLAEMMRETWGCASIAPRHAIGFARAIERAHGIKGGQHGTE